MKRRQIEYSFNHLPSLVLMPESVKEPIKDIPEAEALDIFLLALHQTDGATGKAMPAYAFLKKAEREGRFIRDVPLLSRVQGILP